MQASKLPTESEEQRSAESSTVDGPSPPAGSGETPSGASDPSELSRDDVFGMLSNPRRRATIRHLTSLDEDTVQLRDLAEQLAAWENGVDVEEVTYKQRKRVYTSLYQSHLSKMDDLGIVRFDQNRGTVERTGTTEQIEAYLDTLEDDDLPWGHVSLGTAGLCLGLVGAAWAGLLTAAAGTGYVVALVVAVVFLLVSAAQVLDTR